MRRPFQRFAAYSALTAKRYFRLFPFILIVTVLLIAVLSVALFGLMSDSKEDELNDTVTIAVAGDVDDAYLQIAINAVEKLDLTKYSMKFPLMSEEEAREAFRNSRISGYIIFPEGFMKSARAGEVGQIYYVTSDGNPSLASRFTAEMIKTISSLVLAAQKATYGFEGFALDRGMTYDELIPIAEKAVVKYVGNIVNRGLLYRVEDTGFDGYGTEDDSIVAGIVTVFLTLWGIACCTVATKKDVRLHRSMRAKGVGAAAQIAAEYAAYLFFFITTVALIAAIACVCLAVISAAAPGSIPIDVHTVLTWVKALPFPILVVSSMQFFLYEATSGIQNGVLAQFLTGVMIGFLSGCLYPPYFFPETVQKIGAYLPTGAARSVIASVTSGRSPSTQSILTGLAFFAVFSALSVLFRAGRIKGIKEG